MSVILLIIEIILWILISIIGMIITLTTIILISPIKYEVYFSKENNINYEVKIKYLKFIVANFIRGDESGLQTVKILGKSIYTSEDELPNEDKILDDEKTLQMDVNNKDIQINNIYSYKEDKDTRKVDTKNNKLNHSNSCNKNNHNKESLNINTKKEGINWRQFDSKELYDVTVCTIKFLKQLLVYIFPKDFSFEVVIGRDNPADTACLVSGFIMLYPFYYKHGTVRGDYDREGIRGGFFAEGKFNLARVLVITIRFLMRAPVRNIIKKVSRK